LINLITEILTLNQETAIIVFTRRASEEVKVKRLSKLSYQKNLGLVRSMIQQAVTIASHTTAKVFCIDDTEQIGQSFGEKLSNAFEDIYSKGYKKVIAIGNDCPNLDTETLELAIQKLAQTEVVLGPSKDGGMYLIGMQKEYFERNRSTFERLPWHSNRVFSDFLNLATCQHAKTSILRALLDLDNVLDVQEYLRKTTRVLRAFLSLKHPPFIRICLKLRRLRNYYDSPIIHALQLRGPPTLSLT
jgi:glycosyltransferase A (GT-A) superfamily protein (DUF2064 family)